MKSSSISRTIALLTAAIFSAIAFATEASAQGAKKKPFGIPDVERDKVICFALYTTQNSILKMTAVLYPLNEDEEKKVSLEIERDGKWEQVAEAEVLEEGWTAHFRVEGWDHSRNFNYRVRHAGGAEFAGIVRKDPAEKEEIVVAAFTGNSNRNREPRPDIIANIKAQDPDLLFFSGDHSYDHSKHTAAWLLFGRQFGEIIKDRPTVAIPDDHDVGQGNIWGAGGKKSNLGGGADGGYIMPVPYVNMVQRAQTWHLPDPIDPTPIDRGITVYYTRMNIGGVDFAIIEDRKWKTGPAGTIPKMGPRPDHINDPKYDRKAVDVEGAVLLGKRQLKFLDEWGQDWSGAQMKSVLSQTIFAGGAHIHGGSKNRLLADLDSNGWPQSGRNRALAAMRKAYAFHIAGDQHLATIIRHGIDDWEDANVSFCVPSIVNYYSRWWWPLEDPAPGPMEKGEKALPYTGRYFDGLGNRVTMMAYANPTGENYLAAGHGIIRFKKPTREITVECWPRFEDVTKAEAKQFPGWPQTFRQEDNYGKEAVAYLPTLEVKGGEDPVVQVIEEKTGEVVYTLRIKGTSFQPKVFAPGKYTIKVTKGDALQTYKGVDALAEDEATKLEVQF